jgi:CBS domain-containing protein
MWVRDILKLKGDALYSIDPQCRLADAVRQMVEHDILLGILSFHDLARAALKQASFENQLLKHYIENWPEGDGAGIG